MTPIYTTQPIEIMIDDETFHVVVSDLNASQKEEINKYAAELEFLVECIRKSSSLMDDIETNRELIGCVGILEKTKLLWENKDLKKQISELQNTIGTSNQDQMISDLFMRRLELTISGEDKVKMMAVIKSKMIHPQIIIGAIGKQIEVINQKKLLA